MMDDPFATHHDHAAALLGSKWAGWKLVKWLSDRRLPKQGEFGYGGPRAVYIDRITGEFLGTSPSPAKETFRMSPGDFVGPGTDPSTGGPDWDRGPAQSGLPG